MKKQLFIILSIFLLATNSNVANGYNNVLHEVNNFEFGLQSSVYSNNGILDYSPELGRIGRAIVHMGHRKFWTHPATQNGITYLSWIAPIGKGVTLLSNIIRAGTKLITKQAVKEGLKVEYTFTKSAGKHLTEVVKHGKNAGQLARPYMKSPLTIQKVMSASKGIPDAYFKGGMNWRVPGTFRGYQGIWELGINPKTNVIYHFNFTY
jgi:hypothetical protein